jgi:hypothetical protein
MIRFARCRRPEGERASNRFWCWIVVSPLKPMMVRLLSASPVESVCEVSFANTVGWGWGAVGLLPDQNTSERDAPSIASNFCLTPHSGKPP